MSYENNQSLEIKFKPPMLKQVTKEQQNNYFEEKYGSIAPIFINWRNSKVDDFGRHIFPIENLEKMMNFYQKDKLQPKIGMLLQILGRCSAEDIEELMQGLKKNEINNQVAGNIGKLRENQLGVKSFNSPNRP